MDSIQKLYADIARIKKHERAEKGDRYDAERVCLDVKNLFVRNNSNIRSLAESFTDYWMNEHIRTSTNFKEEPTEENIQKLLAMQSLLDGDEQSLESNSSLTGKDYKELCELTGFEAEDLPLEMLNGLMGIFLDKGAV